MKNNTKVMEVIMLPTDKISSIIKVLDGTLCMNPFKYPNTKGNTNYHLYIVSNAEIKEGNWCVNLANNINQRGNIIQIKKYDDISANKHLEFFKKIEATTDITLEISDEEFHNTFKQTLPQIPESFLQAYIKAEGKIKEVLVEMERTNPEEPNYYALYGKVKIRQDNTIIIHESKKYSREEVISLLEKVYTFGFEGGRSEERYMSSTKQHNSQSLNKWIKENL